MGRHGKDVNWSLLNSSEPVDLARCLSMLSDQIGTFEHTVEEDSKCGAKPLDKIQNFEIKLQATLEWLDGILCTLLSTIGRNAGVRRNA